MKIFILVGSLTTGGAERVASLWAQGFHKNGHNVHIILNNRNKPITYEIPKEVNIVNLYRYKRFKIARVIEYLKELRKYIKQERPNVIITILEPHGIYAKIASLGLNIPIINTEHNAFERPEEAPMKLKQKVYKFYVNKIYDKVTLLTEADQKFIGNRLKNTIVLPNPLTFPIYNEEAKQREKIILAIGRTDAYHYKGFDLAIIAWSRVANKHPEWKLRIVGENNKEIIDKLFSFAEKDIKEQLEFVNFSSKIIEQYRNAEIFVLSSRYEGFGMVLVEAMSQGCACIACDYKGRQVEIIENESNGIIVPANNVDSLSQSMDELITNNERRKELQKNAPGKAKDFLLDRIMEKWETIFKEL